MKQKIFEITKTSEFEELIKQDDKCIIDFYAPWCGPCKTQTLILEELVIEFPNIKFAKLNVDFFIEISEQYGIKNIPTLLIFEKGRVVKEMIGLIKKDTLKNILSS